MPKDNGTSDGGLPEKSRADLHGGGRNAGSLIDTSLDGLSADDIAAIRKQALEKKLELDADRYERDVKHEQGRRTLQDHVDTWNTLNRDGRLTTNKVTSEFETGSGKMKVESKSGVTCFVASATYGDPDHRDVQDLRHFRDHTLIRTSVGRAFINCYWKIGPLLAKIVERSVVAKLFSKFIISRLVRLIRRYQSG